MADLFLAHCPGGHVIRGTAADFNEGRGWLRCGCGMTAPARLVDAVRSARVACGPRCHQAQGLTCHCACAGTNHGAALVYRKPIPITQPGDT